MPARHASRALLLILTLNAVLAAGAAGDEHPARPRQVRASTAPAESLFHHFEARMDSLHTLNGNYATGTACVTAPLSLELTHRHVYPEYLPRLETIPLTFDRPVTGFGISGRLRRIAGERSALAVFMVDQRGIMWQVFQTMTTTDVLDFAMDGVCEETCVLPDSTIPRCLWVQLENADLDLDAVVTTRTESGVDRLALHARQVDFQIDAINAENEKDGWGWRAGHTGVNDRFYHERPCVGGPALCNR